MENKGMKNDFALAFKEVLEDKGLPQEVVLEAIEAAMVSAYRRSVNASNAQHVEAKINPENGKVVIYAEKEVVDSVQDERTEVALENATNVDPDSELGSMVIVESTPKDFGRVAAQTARQVIQQRIREAEREAQYNYYVKQVGEIVSGVVQAINPQAVNLGLEMKAEGVMPRNQQIPREHFRVHDRVRTLLMEIKVSSRGPQIILSRAHRDFLRRLLENEVPEIYHGLVEIRSIAREPGHRSKVAVAALQPGVDPVGACVGIRGVRIQTIVRELNDEKIDVIEWNPDPAAYIAKALSPARVNGVFLDENTKGIKTATVVVPEDQLSLAIGRDGQNARLAAKLTSWRIDIKSLPEATSDVLFKLQNDPEYMPYAESETETIGQIEASMAKKAEGRPIMPEEYHTMATFVNRVEQNVIQTRLTERKEREERIAAAEKIVPREAFDLPLDVLGLPTRIQNLIFDAKFENLGDIMLQMALDESIILGISGIGPKAMEEIKQSIDALQVFVEEPEPEVLETEEEVVSEAPPEPEGVEAVPEVDGEEPQVTETAPEAEAETEEVKPIEEKISAEPQIEAEEELPTDLEEIFKLKPEMLEGPELVDEVEEEAEEVLQPETKKVKKKSKKRETKKYVEIEYDPDQDVTLYRRKRKRGGVDDWEDEWDA
jgi:N utilization substance protein A